MEAVSRYAMILSRSSRLDHPALTTISSIESYTYLERDILYVPDHLSSCRVQGDTSSRYVANVVFSHMDGFVSHRFGVL